MAGQYERTQPGHRDTLEPWQQHALFDLWTRFFDLCQVPPGTDAIPQDATSSSSPWKASLPCDTNFTSLDAKKSLHHANNKTSSADDPRRPSTDPPFLELRSSTSASSQAAAAAAVRDDNGPPRDDAVKAQVQGQQELKEMRSFLQKYGGQRLRKVFWQMIKGEHPDAVMLRCLRARKWDIDRALAILGAIAAWRVEEKVEEIVQGADVLLTRTRGGLNVYQNGICYVRGSAVTGEPIYIIEVGNHYSSSQTQEELKRKIILDLEMLTALMPPPVERKVVIFNMKNFSLRNMDYWCVFYLVKSMQKYPETLARVYVHQAPWIFKPIWAFLRPLLDPIVREKIRLTSDVKELEEYIPLNRLPKESMNGQMDWVYEWQPPAEDENDIQLDTASRDALQEEYFTICFQLERATRAVAGSLSKFRAEREGSPQASSSSASERGRYDRHNPPPHQDTDDASSIVGGGEWDEPPELASLKAKRDVLATKLRVIWLQLRPYMAGKTVLDRWNVLRGDGTIVWTYPNLDGTIEEQRFGDETSLQALSNNLDVIRQSMDVDRPSRAEAATQDVNLRNDKHGGSNGVIGDGNRRQKKTIPRCSGDLPAPALVYSGGVSSTTSVPLDTATDGSHRAVMSSTPGTAPLTAHNLSYINGEMDKISLKREDHLGHGGAATAESGGDIRQPRGIAPFSEASALGPDVPIAAETSNAKGFVATEGTAAVADATDADSTAPLPPSSIRAEGSMSSADTLRGIGGAGGVPTPLRPLSSPESTSYGGTAAADPHAGAGAVAGTDTDTPATSLAASSAPERREDLLLRSQESDVPVHPLMKKEGGVSHAPDPTAATDVEVDTTALPAEDGRAG